MSQPRRQDSARGLWQALVVLLLLNAAIVAVAWVFRQTVVPGWKKGPLIDPAAPYSPENAQLLFSVGLCVALDLYVLLLAIWRRFRPPRWWVPWLALLLSAAGAEGALRAWLAVDMVTYFRPHPILHWVVRPDLRDFDNLTGGGRITTNHDGLRMPGPDAVRERGQADPDAFRILVLGDSSNFGHGVEGEEMWSAVLEPALDRLTPRRVEVINGACPGWTTFQAVEFMRLVGLAYHPDLVIAGFNNDPGPDYLHDADRVLPPGLRRDLSALAWNSELYLLSREVLLSLIRRLSPAARAVYTERHAGDDPKYGKLSAEEAAALVPRVPLPDFLANVSTLHRMGEEEGFAFAWIDMPVNRNEPELVERYVDWGYRDAVRGLAKEEGFPVVEVDQRQVRQRARGLHVEGHVFHPNADGHRRLAQQVGHLLVTAGMVPGAHGDVHIDGPQPLTDEAILRFGWSSRTPVHAHVGAVLDAMPDLAARHGITLVSHRYDSGKAQGGDVADGSLDAFFTTGVPALHMLDGRPDVRVVGTPGTLGRMGVVAPSSRARQLSDLRGARVGLAEGSTAALRWASWGEGLGAAVVPLRSDALEAALAAGEVDAIVGWDPWVELWLRTPGRSLLADAPFSSLLAVGIPWAAPMPVPQAAPESGARAAALLALVEDALAVAAADRPRWDAVVAERSGWPVEVVRAVADRNEILSGRARHLDVGAALRAELTETADWLQRPDLGPDQLLGLDLLQGRPLRLRGGPRLPPRPAAPAGAPPAALPPPVPPAQPRSGSP